MSGNFLYNICPLDPYSVNHCVTIFQNVSFPSFVLCGRDKYAILSI